MHQIEPYLPALNRYAKSLVKGKPHLDYQDIAQEAILACLVANPKELTEGYVLGAARSRAFNIFRQPLVASLDDNYMHTYTVPYDTEEMYETELLFKWAEKVLDRKEDLPTTKLEAEQLGSIYYFTGVPCKNGHVCKRFTTNRHCYECGVISAQQKKNIYLKRYRSKIKTKERKKEYHKQYREKDKEAYLARRRELHKIRKLATQGIIKNKKNEQVKTIQYEAA